MRMNLKVPFAEKDAAKKLGARWDAASKVWYIEGNGDLTAFAKWSPTLGLLVPGGDSPRLGAADKNTQASGKVFVGANYVEYPRVCQCLPWDICDQCRSTALNI